MSNLTLNSTIGPTPPTERPPRTTEQALCYVIALLCLVGLVGNAMVMFYFCFRIKLNQSTVYILNLGVADFLFSGGCCVVCLYFLSLFNGVTTSRKDKRAIAIFGELLISFTFTASLFLLATLSCERCMSVCFPLWYKCRRPTHLSAILSSVMWGMSLLIAIVERFLVPEHRSTVYIVTSALFVLVTLLMVGSSVVLLLQIQKSSMECRPLKLYIVVIASIINYLISLAPSRIVRMVFLLATSYFDPTPYDKRIAFFSICLCSAFNSAANPYIYIVVGMWKKKVSTAQALELAFQDGSNQTSEENITMGSDQSDAERKPEVRN